MQATYPLDTMRLRMAVDPKVNTMRAAAAVLMREGSYGAFFRGLSASLIGEGLPPPPPLPMPPAHIFDEERFDVSQFIHAFPTFIRLLKCCCTISCFAVCGRLRCGFGSVV
jgi:hypothetical protein